MKNFKVTKILVLAISFVLLLGAVIGISVSATEAEDTYTYEIPMINISHGASSSMLFAVDAPIDEAAAGNVVVTYTYYLGAEKKEAVAAYSAEITSDANIGMPVFYTVGISPKDQGEEITVEAHKASAPEDFEPLYYTTSIGKYLYSKLYRDGLIYSKDATEQKLAKMYLAQIAYVSTAQDALWNVDNPGAQRTILDSYKYVAVKDGKITSTGNSHDLIAGDTVNVTYTGSGAAPSGWNVTTYDTAGNPTVTYVGGNQISLTASAVLTPFVDPDVITFDDLNVDYNFATDNYYYNGALRLMPDAATENYLKVTKGRDGDNGVVFEKYYWLYSHNYANENHNVSLLQFDTDCTSNAHNVEHQMIFRNEADTNQFQVFWRYYCSGSSHWVRFNVKDLVSGVAFDASYHYFPKDTEANTKFNVKIEYLWSEGKLRISVDDNVCAIFDVASSTTPIKRVNMQAVKPDAIIFDNIKQTTIYVDPTEFNDN